MIITSTSNPAVKQIRKLRERKERQQTGLFYIEGLRIVGEAVQRGAHLETLVIAPQLLVSEFGRKLVEEARRRGTALLEVSAEVFEGISLKEGPQGVAAVVRQRWEKLEDVRLEKGGLWIALDAVADPGNLGTILRTLDAVGGKGVVLLDQSTDPFDPAAVRGSMGSIFALKLVKCAFQEFAQWKKDAAVGLVGTSGAAEQDYHTFSYPSPLVLLMGSERQGLQAHHLQLCDAVVRIPMAGKADSLNLAVAAGIVLYEVFNRRRENAAGERGGENDSSHTG